MKKDRQKKEKDKEGKNPKNRGNLTPSTFRME